MFNEGTGPGQCLWWMDTLTVGHLRLSPTEVKQVAERPVISGSFGRGGVFNALRAKSARVMDAYRLAFEMNDLHIGDAHLIENINETEEHSSNEGSANGRFLSYQDCTFTTVFLNQITCIFLSGLGIKNY